MPEVLILTGPPGSGKSTVARALADRYDRVAHIAVDALHEFITDTGRVMPWGPADAWARQEALLTRAACGLVLTFLSDRFAVVVDDVVFEAEHLGRYVEALKAGSVPVHYVRLIPRLETVQQRNATRSEDQRMHPRRVERVWGQFAAAGDIGGCTIDSSELSAFETADKLQALTTSGASIVWRPE